MEISGLFESWREQSGAKPSGNPDSNCSRAVSIMQYRWAKRVRGRKQNQRQGPVSTHRMKERVKERTNWESLGSVGVR